MLKIIFTKEKIIGCNHMFVILEKLNKYTKNYKGLIIISKYVNC